MNTAMLRRVGFAALAAGAVGALVGCSSNDPLSSGSSTGSSGSIVVVHQDYYSNEIIARLYYDVLEHGGVKATWRSAAAGQREAYISKVESGDYDLIPEYNGSLLYQVYDKKATATTSSAIDAALSKKLPDGLRILDSAPATDSDTITVTKSTAKEYGLSSIGDLTKVGKQIKIGANTEFQTRPYGPKGLKSRYGVDATVSAIEDSGGPLTLKALKAGSVQAADIYSASPSFATENIVALKDTKHLIPVAAVTPLVSKRVNAKAVRLIDAVNKKLTTNQLIALNKKSTVDKEDSSKIAHEWLKKNGLL